MKDGKPVVPDKVRRVFCFLTRAASPSDEEGANHLKWSDFMKVEGST